MKGIVVDIKGKYAVALNKDGSFIKIKNKAQYKVGHEIEFDPNPHFNRSLFVKVSSIAAAFLFVVGISYSVYSYNSPYSYVNVDINPSVELTANVYDKIINVEALNDDGKRLLESKNLKNVKLEEGIKELLDNAVEQGYIKADTQNAVVLTVTSKNKDKSDKLKKGLEDTAINEFNKDKVNSDVLAETSSITNHEAARQMGISPGKLSLIEKLRKVEPNLKLEDLKDTPVKDIMKSLKKYKKEEKQEKQEKQNTKDKKTEINNDQKDETTDNKNVADDGNKEQNDDRDTVKNKENKNSENKINKTNNSKKTDDTNIINKANKANKVGKTSKENKDTPKSNVSKTNKGKKSF